MVVLQRIVSYACSWDSLRALFRELSEVIRLQVGLLQQGSLESGPHCLIRFCWAALCRR